MRSAQRIDHNGVLFLDELPEFNRRSLEVLRQPLEEGRVTISRALTSTTFPARLVLIAALNPCQCGYFGDASRPCRCTPPQVEKYRSRVSGPLLDRIDLHVEVPAVPYKALSATADGTSSAAMRAQVEAARTAQRERFGDLDSLNGRMGPRETRRYCALDAEGQGLLKAAMETLGLSARAHDRILRVARTVADLEGAAKLKAEHVAEAVGYRSLDRKFFAG